MRSATGRRPPARRAATAYGWTSPAPLTCSAAKHAFANACCTFSSAWALLPALPLRARPVLPMHWRTIVARQSPCCRPALKPRPLPTCRLPPCDWKLRRWPPPRALVLSGSLISTLCHARLWPSVSALPPSAASIRRVAWSRSRSCQSCRSKRRGQSGGCLNPSVRQRRSPRSSLIWLMILSSNFRSEV